MSRFSEKRSHYAFFCVTNLAPVILAALLVILLSALQHMLLFQRKIRVRSMEGHHTQSPTPRPALVTLADPSFQYCAVELLASARSLKWTHPLFLLAIDFHHFHPDVLRKLQILGVFVVETNSIFDEWLTKSVDKKFLYRQLDFRKFRKMELFLNPIFRSFERLIYIDADGQLSSGLEPLLHIQFPSNVTLLMRQNDRSMGKATLWGNEMDAGALTKEQLSTFSKGYPDRSKSGASCWFLVDVKKLPPPDAIFSKSLDVICTYRAAFKLNDQTLLNLLFYDSLSLFPWCVWDVVPIIEDSDELKRFCKSHMRLQRWINGDLAFIFRHLSVEEKKNCVATSMPKWTYNENRIPLQEVSTGRLREKKSFFSIFNNTQSCSESHQQWKENIQPRR